MVRASPEPNTQGYLHLPLSSSSVVCAVEVSAGQRRFVLCSAEESSSPDSIPMSHDTSEEFVLDWLPWEISLVDLEAQK